MVAPLLALLVAAQAAQPADQAGFDCRLTTVDGQSLGFAIDTRRQQGRLQLRLRPAGRGWPGRPTGFIGADSSGFPIGSGREALSIEFAGRSDLDASRDWSPIAIMRGQDAERALPLAYGFCTWGRAPRLAEPLAGTAAFPSVAIRTLAAATPSRPNCHLVARDGRRSRFGYGPNPATIVPYDAQIWSQPPAFTRTPIPPPPPRGRIPVNPFADFRPLRGSPGPLALEMAYEDGGAGRVVALIEFIQTNRGGPGDTPAFGICSFKRTQPASASATGTPQ